YLSPKNSPSLEGWSGAILGPIAAAFGLLGDVIRLTKKDQFASPECVCISRLAEHVLENAKEFKAWRQFAIRRLTDAHPRRDADKIGDPVPREVLDPDFDYSPELAPGLLAKPRRKPDP